LVARVKNDDIASLLLQKNKHALYLLRIDKVRGVFCKILGRNTHEKLVKCETCECVTGMSTFCC